jgi:hypothetical protein
LLRRPSNLKLRFTEEIEMWILIQYDRRNDTQSNIGLVSDDTELLNFINGMLQTSVGAERVMLPEQMPHVDKKMYPLITSRQHDYYAQWFTI